MVLHVVSLQIAALNKGTNQAQFVPHALGLHALLGTRGIWGSLHQMASSWMGTHAWITYKPFPERQQPPSHCAGIHSNYTAFSKEG